MSIKNKLKSLCFKLDKMIQVLEEQSIPEVVKGGPIGDPYPPDVESAIDDIKDEREGKEVRKNYPIYDSDKEKRSKKKKKKKK